MTKPNSEYQRAHRERRATERRAMIEALEAIAERTKDAKFAMSQDAHRLALQGLGREAALKALGEGK